MWIFQKFILNELSIKKGHAIRRALYNLEVNS